MSPIFTHTLDFKLAESGSLVIEGEAEFNVDGETTFNTTTPLPEMSLAQAKAFHRFLEELKNLFDAFEGFAKVEIKKKT